MTAIAGSRSDNRNDIIDWLRQQGFTFAHASWLERIHHNGGRLIYEGGDGRMPRPARRQPAAHAALHPHSPAGVETVDALIAAARAYRPLAQAVLRDILAAAPRAAATVVSDYVAVSHSQPFAALLVSPRDVRLFLAVGPEGEPDGWQRIKALNPPVEMLSHLSHMLVLTDARQLTAGLRGLIVESARSCRADSKRD